jgi:hypothetical protein
VARAYNPCHSRGRDQENGDLRPPWAKSETLSQNQPTQKAAGSSGRMLPRRHETLSSNPSQKKKDSKQIHEKD